MKKGINIWSFTSGTLLDKFKLAADAGFDGVEVAIGDVGEAPNVNALFHHLLLYLI